MAETKKKEFGSDEALLKAKSDALRLLSFSPRSADELAKRLKLKKYGASIVDEVIGSFKKQGLIDDEKFAKLYAGDRIYTRPTGRRQLAADLKKKGVSEKIISKTLSAIGDYDEKRAAKEMVFTRFQKMTGVSDEKKRSRIFGFLKRRGFSNDVVFSVLKELFKENDSLYNLD